MLQDMAKDYSPDEEALRKAYESDPTRFRTDEERRARHILIAVDESRTESAARSLADDIAGKLASGGDDYQVVCTAHPEAAEALGLTVIGEVMAGQGIEVLAGGAPIDPGPGGWTHR